MLGDIELKASPGSPFTSYVVEANCLTPSLCVSFFICEMTAIVISTHWVVMGIQ